jgi:hypothetical protein
LSSYYAVFPKGPSLNKKRNNERKREWEVKKKEYERTEKKYETKCVT